MGVIEEIYEDIEIDLSFEEYETAVQERIEKMGGLADEETAAMLVAHELDESGGEVDGIADIEPGMDEVKFVGKVVSVGELRTFERDEDKSPEQEESEDAAPNEGHVMNVDIADETGQVRIALWDQYAVDATESLAVGDVLRVKGRPKEGYSGIEVNVNEVEPDPDTEIDVQITDTYQIEELSLGLSDVNLKGQVLDTDTIRTFQRDDGSEGQVANATLGDPTGRIRVTFWDEMADQVEQLTPGESIEVVDGYVREQDGDLELHVGNRGAVEHLDEQITYEPEATPIAELSIEETVDVTGVVRSTDPKRTFDRDDGSEGQVKNIRIQDETGDLRVALWGDLADREIGPGDRVAMTDIEIQDGWQDDLEGSANWRSSVTVLDEADDEPTQASTTNDSGIDLSSFDDGDRPETDATGKTDEDTTEDTSNTGAQIEFTGTVVQTGTPVILDNGEETISIETSEDVHLGEELTVRGTRDDDGRIDATDLF